MQSSSVDDSYRALVVEVLSFRSLRLVLPKAIPTQVLQGTGKKGKTKERTTKTGEIKVSAANDTVNGNNRSSSKLPKGYYWWPKSRGKGFFA